MLSFAFRTLMAAVQREEPVAIAGRTANQRYEADFQSFGSRRHESQQCLSQHTSGFPL